MAVLGLFTHTRTHARTHACTHTHTHTHTHIWVQVKIFVSFFQGRWGEGCGVCRSGDHMSPDGFVYGYCWVGFPTKLLYKVWKETFWKHCERGRWGQGSVWRPFWPLYTTMRLTLPSLITTHSSDSFLLYQLQLTRQVSSWEKISTLGIQWPV